MGATGLKVPSPVMPWGPGRSFVSYLSVMTFAVIRAAASDAR